MAGPPGGTPVSGPTPGGTEDKPVVVWAVRIWDFEKFGTVSLGMAGAVDQVVVDVCGGVVVV